MGWTQVAAHGTGCQFSTVDEMIVEIEIVTEAFYAFDLKQLFQYPHI